MDNNLNNGINENMFSMLDESTQEEQVKIVKTDVDAVNGQDKCPKCGATDISLNTKKGMLRCNFCRHEFAPQKVQGLEEDVKNLHNQVIASGAADIDEEAETLITLKCTSCGAEVVIDTNESNQARCHWCRNTLSINQQIPNGSVPDVVLPFSVEKQEAQSLISKFVGKRKFFAHPKFKKEFTTDNIMGVYFPYMMVDINGHARFSGQGEHLVRRYTVGSGDDKKTYYDADLYDVEREFDIAIKGLTVESSADKLDKKQRNKTNNIINSIMPFDIENAVRWNANYIKGYSSEKRDVNIDQLKPQVQIQAEDIARFAANDELSFYDRGVKWAVQKLDIEGQQWQAAHFPVWLYSYFEKKGSKGMLHYVAVNARTKETMGSVPIHMPKLLFTSFLVELLSGFAVVQIESEEGGEAILLTLGFIFFFIMYSRYRNSSARHTHELETAKEKSNLRSEDNFVKHRKGLSNSEMSGANNETVFGNRFSKDLF
ncbi:MAG: TFIIB-type zinc ribbon-containing protein [Lachnospiraceae bacterium]|nr:TFIIB-type zinc ribbon-containing protein [Lachnospiraceae bacterium]